MASNHAADISPGPPASFKRRSAARAVDLLTVATWVWALSVTHVLYFVPRWSSQVKVGPWGTSFLLLVSFIVIYAVYEIVFLARTGSTPGKDLMNLKVIHHETDELPTLSQAALRSLPLVGVWLTPFWWIGLLLTGAFGASGLAESRRYRGLHDRISGTRVIVQHPSHHSGLDAEEARAERMAQFIPRFVDPFQVLPTQALNYPGAPKLQGRNEPDPSPNR